MTELPGLPSFGAEPAFAADDAAYGAVVGRARTRRRARLAAASAAAAVAVVVATVNSPAAQDSAGLQPADGLPSATATTGPSPDPEPSATAAPGDPATTADPTAEPGEPGSPGSPEPEHPEYEEEGYVVSDPWCAETQSFGDCADEGGGLEPDWREDSGFTGDRPEEGCAQAPLEGWCFRYLGPFGTKAGSHTRFRAELCRTAGRFAARADFEHEQELGIVVSSRPTDEGVIEHTGVSYLNRNKSRHSREIPVGTCLRWTLRWNGVTDQGVHAPAGEYELKVVLLGTTPRDPVPGEANQAKESGHAAFVDDFVIR